MAAMTEPLRVVLVDDETLVRAGLRMILEGDPAISIVGEAADGEAGVEAVRRLRPDVVLMDIRMPRMDGLAATEQILISRPETRVIVLTSFDVDELVPRALQIGARGYLLKDTPPAELVDAVHRVAHGNTVLSQEAIGHLIDTVSRHASRSAPNEPEKLLGTLTKRELSIADAVAQGFSNAQIAKAHDIGVTTVKTHVSRILDKLGVSNRVQIAALVQRARD